MSEDVTAHWPVDLHVHSRFSDGTDSPSEIIARARRSGVRVVSLVDHDSVAGVDEACEAGRSLDVEVVPGVEFSVANNPEQGFLEIHVLGYFVDHHHPHLVDAVQRAAQARTEQKLDSARALQALGFDVPIEEVLAAAGTGVLGRMHVAQVAWERNPGRFRDREQIFREYISVGGRAYVPRRYQMGLGEAVQLVRRAGGLATLAHPGVYRWGSDAETPVRHMTELGVQALEGPYTYDKNRPHFGMKTDAVEAMIERFSQLAHRFGLGLTGGSDYHGERKSIELGERGLSEADYRALRQRWVG